MATATQAASAAMDDRKFIEDLRSRFNSGERLEYVFFWGNQPSKHGVTPACLSQWYESPFVVEGRRYPTAEHFMMAEKAALFEDEEVLSLVLGAPDPSAAKALGRRVQGFDQTVWLEHRFSLVVRGNEAKFSQNPALRRYLVETGTRVLVEASPVDPVWGIGLAQNDERANNPNQWRGLNLLGFALMQVRSNMAA
ncbi:MAG: NADAR family protein [Rhodocyclaceae bacterium]